MVYQLSRLMLTFEPDVYYLDAEIDLLHAHTRQTELWVPSLVVGKVFMNRPIEEQRVLLARKLALFRPELRILTVVPDEEASCARCLNGSAASEAAGGRHCGLGPGARKRPPDLCGNRAKT